MQESCKESCMKGSKLDLTSGTCVECTEKTIGQTCRGCFEKCAFEKFQQVQEELVAKLYLCISTSIFITIIINFYHIIMNKIN